MMNKKNSAGNSYIHFWKNAFNFKGRTRRSDFWNAYIINMILGIVISFFNLVEYEPLQMLTAILYILYSVAILIPQLSITVRRLHDVGKDGFYIFIGLIPVAGQIILFLNLIKDSQQEPNKFGESTKYITVQNTAEEEKVLCPICKSEISPDDTICPKCSSVINREGAYGQL